MAFVTGLPESTLATIPLRMPVLSHNNANGWDEVGKGNANVEYPNDAKRTYTFIVWFVSPSEMKFFEKSSAFDRIGLVKSDN